MDNIKSMQLYPRPERIYNDLKALGYGEATSVPVDVLNRFDQLHYHGTIAVEQAVKSCGIGPGDRVLEVGSGWGGCARYVAHASGAHVTAVELQEDYDRVARDLTSRAEMTGEVTHVNADFLALDLPDAGFAHAVSWLALFHIPDRARYLEKIRNAVQPGGRLFAEDLYLIEAPADDEMEDFQRHLFPNSLVSDEDYRAGLEAAGFELEEATDMTADWSAFTSERLAAFRANKAQYEAIHGAPAYQCIELFYEKMAGYFARGLVGGIRFSARRG